MKHVLSQKNFNAKIKSIGTTRAKFSVDVHVALIAATFLCINGEGTTSPLEQVLDAVGTTAHRKGVTAWIETYAPALMREGKVVKNKTAFDGLDIDAIKLDFDAYVEESGMDKVRWDTIAAAANTTESIFDLDKTLDSFLKKLEKNGLAGMAQAMRKAEQDYLASAIKAAQPVHA
jgi:dihydroxyacetone kinase